MKKSKIKKQQVGDLKCEIKDGKIYKPNLDFIRNNTQGTVMNFKNNVTKSEIDSLSNYSVRKINEDYFKNKKLYELPITSEQIEIFNDHAQFQDKLYCKLLFCDGHSYAFFKDSVVQIKKNKTMCYYVKGLTLDSVIDYYINKNNLYCKDGSYNSFAVTSIFTASGLRHSRVYKEKGDIHVSCYITKEKFVFKATNDIVFDITYIWNLGIKISKDNKMSLSQIERRNKLNKLNKYKN